MTTEATLDRQQIERRLKGIAERAIHIGGIFETIRHAGDVGTLKYIGDDIADPSSVSRVLLFSAEEAVNDISEFCIMLFEQMDLSSSMLEDERPEGSKFLFPLNEQEESAPAEETTEVSHD